MSLRPPLTLSIPALALIGAAQTVSGQESPYFITYTHHMEEPGSLEVALNPVFGVGRKAPNGSWPPPSRSSTASMDGGHPSCTSTGRTVSRIDTLHGLSLREPLSPVDEGACGESGLYIEYEDITGADKIFKEVVGFDTFRGLLEPAEELRREKKREVEAKLILSSDLRGSNLAGNLIAEKNLAGEP